MRQIKALDTFVESMMVPWRSGICILMEMQAEREEMEMEIDFRNKTKLRILLYHNRQI